MKNIDDYISYDNLTVEACELLHEKYGEVFILRNGKVISAYQDLTEID